MDKLIKLGALALLASFGLIIGCGDDDPVEKGIGTLNFDEYVAVGNSLTAGFISGALAEQGQMYSYPNLITQRVAATDGNTYGMAQPIVSDPGISSTYLGAGVLELLSIALDTVCTDPLTIVSKPNIMPAAPGGSLTGLPPYNNLGVPGAYVGDFAVATSGANSWLSVLGAAYENSFFTLFVQGQTQAALMAAKGPTFVTFWLGNNDVLGYATKGGDIPAQIENLILTDATTFQAAWSAAADLVDATGADVVTANLPYVTDIPFFTTIGSSVAADIPGVGCIDLSLYYLSDGAPTAATASDLILLTASSVIANADSADTSGNAYGLNPANPLSDKFVLDAAEQAKLSARINAHNTFIEAEATTRGWGLVDFNALLTDIKANGLTVGSTTFTADFITGNLFSLDGVHPTAKGYGVVANEFIDVMNTKFNAEILTVDVSTLPGVEIPTSASIRMNPFTRTPILSEDAVNVLNSMFGMRNIK